MTNPFREKAAGGDDVSAEAPVAAEETVAAAPAESTPEAAEAAEAAEDDSFGKFTEPGKGKPSQGVQKRISKLVGERNSLREMVEQRELALAAAKAKAETLETLHQAVSEKYRTNPDLLRFDADFMSTFEKLAAKDPSLAQAAAKVKAAMNGVKIVTTPEQTAIADEAVETDEAAEIDPALEAVLTRDVTRQFTEVLTQHEVKPHFVQAALRDVMLHVPVAQLVNATPEQVVELAKVYFEETGIPPTEFLAPQKAGKKAPASTAGRQAPRVTPAASAGETPETPKFKTREEYEAHRQKRFAQLARETYGS